MTTAYCRIIFKPQQLYVLQPTPECVCGGVILRLWGVWFNNLGVSGVFYTERSQTRRTPPCHAKSSRGACGFIQPRPALQPFGSFTGSPCDRSHRPQIERWGEWRLHIAGYDANEVSEQESDAEEKFTKQLLFGSARVTRGGDGIYRASALLCLP